MIEASSFTTAVTNCGVPRASFPVVPTPAPLPSRVARLTALLAGLGLSVAARAQVEDPGLGYPHLPEDGDTYPALAPDTAAANPVPGLARPFPNLFVGEPSPMPAEPAGLTPADLNLDRLERRHFRHPDNPQHGLALAEAYLYLGRVPEAKRVLKRYPGRRRAPAGVYFLLASLHYAEGDFLLAEAVASQGLKRYRREPALAALRARARTRQGYAEEDPWHMRDEMDNAPTVGLQVVALGAFERDDLVTGLLAAEALYFLGGARATTRALDRRVELAYDALIRAAAAAEPLARDYPAGSFEATYLASLNVAAAQVVGRLPTFAHRLDVFAAIRAGALDHYLATAEVDPDEPLRRRLRERPYAAEVLEAARAARADGLLRWFTLASLRHLDVGYFAALTRERSGEWEHVRESFATYHL